MKARSGRSGPGGRPAAVPGLATAAAMAAVLAAGTAGAAGPVDAGPAAAAPAPASAGSGAPAASPAQEADAVAPAPDARGRQVPDSVPEEAGAPLPPAGSTAAPGPTRSELDRLTARVAAQLRCPVCRNQSVLESSATLSQQMQSEIRRRLASGESPAEVKSYFVSRYGEWILLQPEPEGLNLLVYVLPALALLGGGLLVWRRLQAWTGAAAAGGGEHGTQPSGESGAGGGSGPAGDAADAGGVSPDPSSNGFEEGAGGLSAAEEARVDALVREGDASGSG